MALRIIELDIDEFISGDTRVEEIALVLQPAIETEFMYFKQQSFETYNDYPEAAKNNACKVLRWRDEHGEDVKGMTSVGWIRANQLCGGENISEETIARMSSFQRHRQNSEIADEYKGTPWMDAGYVAWLGWGGTEGVEWAQKKLVSIRHSVQPAINWLVNSFLKHFHLCFSLWVRPWFCFSRSCPHLTTSLEKYSPRHFLASHCFGCVLYFY